MGKFLFLLLILSFLGCATSSPDLEKQGRLYLQLGTSQLSRGIYPQALESLLRAEAILPDNPKVQNNLGLAYYVRKKTKKAKHHIRRAVELDPGYTEARNNLSRILTEHGQYKLAIKHLLIAKKDLTYPSPEKTLANFGYTYFEAKKYKKALKYLKLSLKSHRKDCNSYTYYGRSLYELKKYVLASKALSNASNICTAQRSETSKYYNALSQIKLGEKSNATAIFEEIIQFSPESTYAKKSQKMLTLLKRAE